MDIQNYREMPIKNLGITGTIRPMVFQYIVPSLEICINTLESNIKYIIPPALLNSRIVNLYESCSIEEAASVVMDTFQKIETIVCTIVYRLLMACVDIKKRLPSLLFKYATTGLVLHAWGGLLTYYLIQYLNLPFFFNIKDQYTRVTFNTGFVYSLKSELENMKLIWSKKPDEKMKGNIMDICKTWLGFYFPGETTSRVVMKKIIVWIVSSALELFSARTLEIARMILGKLITFVVYVAMFKTVIESVSDFMRSLQTSGLILYLLPTGFIPVLTLMYTFRGLEDEAFDVYRAVYILKVKLSLSNTVGFLLKRVVAEALRGLFLDIMFASIGLGLVGKTFQALSDDTLVRTLTNSEITGVALTKLNCLFNTALSFIGAYLGDNWANTLLSPIISVSQNVVMYIGSLPLEYLSILLSSCLAMSSLFLRDLLVIAQGDSLKAALKEKSEIDL